MDVGVVVEVADDELPALVPKRGPESATQREVVFMRDLGKLLGHRLPVHDLLALSHVLLQSRQRDCCHVTQALTAGRRASARGRPARGTSGTKRTWNRAARREAGF